MDSENQIRPLNADIPNEVWKPVIGWEGFYEVSNLGRAKSLARTKRNGKGRVYMPERILKPFPNTQGYLCIDLRREGESHKKTLHRLIASAFIPNPDNKPCIDHIDTNRQNNTVDNLRWCTVLENRHNPISEVKYSKGGMMGKNHPEKRKRKIRESQPHSRAVLQFTKEGELIAEYQSVNAAARAVGASQSNMTHACAGRKSCSGYLWRYKDAYNE